MNEVTKMTTKFKCYTKPIGSNETVFIINDITIDDFENLKHDLKTTLNINDYLSIKLNLTTDKIFASHYVIKYDLNSFILAILDSFKLSDIQIRKKIQKLQEDLIANNIEVQEGEVNQLSLKFKLLENSYLFDIYVNELNQFRIDLYKDGNFEGVYNSVEYDENEEQPYFLILNENDENPLTIEQIVNTFKELQKLVKQCKKIEDNLPF